MKKILNELQPVLLLIVSVILFIMLTGIGVIHLIFISSWKRKPGYFFKYWVKLLYQFWNGVKYLCLHIAISLDLIGNVSCGDGIKDLVTEETDTLYGNGNVTISAATGDIENKDKLNKTGKGFSLTLTKLLGKNHCLNAYRRYLYDNNFKEE